MKTTATSQSKERILYIVLGVFMLGVCAYVYEEIFAGSSAPASAPVVASAPTPAAATAASNGPAAKKVATTSASLDPTLHMEAMLVSEAV